MTHTAENSTRRTRVARPLAVAFLACAAVLLFRASGPCDDDFIAYRYAQNLVRGHGLVFNAGERVEGFTCPLWTLLAAGALALGIAAPLATALLGCASAVGAALLALVPRDAGGGSSRGALAAALAIAVSPLLAYHAAQGLGTALCAALVLGAYVALRRALARERVDGRASARGVWLASALCAGLAPLVRPETFVFLPAFAWAVPARRRLAWCALALAAPAAWLAFRLAYYGAWLPVTWSVKKLPFATDLAYGGAYLAEATLACGIGVLLVLCVVARARQLALTERAATAALAGALLHTAAVVFVGGDYMPLARFCVPALPLVFVLAGEVCDAAARARPVLTWSVAVACGVATLWPYTRAAEFRELHAFDEVRWIAIGEELARRAPADCRVAVAPVGAIGFYSGLPIVDTLGVTNAAISTAEPDLAITLKGHHRYDAEFVLRAQPDVVILGNGVMPAGERRLLVSAWERTLFQHPRFAAEYEPRSIDVAGSYPLLYFARRGGRELAGSASATTRR